MEEAKAIAKAAKRPIPVVKTFKSGNKLSAPTSASAPLKDKVSQKRSQPVPVRDKTLVKRPRVVDSVLPSPGDDILGIPLNQSYDLDSFFNGISSGSGAVRSSPTNGVLSSSQSAVFHSLCSVLEGSGLHSGTLSKAKLQAECLVRSVTFMNLLETGANRVSELSGELSRLRDSQEKAVAEGVERLAKEKVDLLVRERVEATEKKWMADKAELVKTLAERTDDVRNSLDQRNRALNDLKVERKRAEEAERQLAGFKSYFEEGLEGKFAEGWAEGNVFTKRVVDEFVPTFDWDGYGALEAKKIEEERDKATPVEEAAGGSPIVDVEATSSPLEPSVA